MSGVEHLGASWMSDMADEGRQQVLRAENVIDQFTHLRMEEQIAKTLPLVNQKRDNLLLVGEDTGFSYL